MVDLHAMNARFLLCVTPHFHLSVRIEFNYAAEHCYFRIVYMHDSGIH